jgi:UDP-glucose 4-epimerase
MRILLTGGAGYIGSHAAVELLRRGYDPIIFDNFSNSTPTVVSRISKLTGVRPIVIRGDIRNENALVEAFQHYKPAAVIHFAGLKAVGESMTDPLIYFSNNIVGSQLLLSAMHRCDIKKIIFSSSATVYGQPTYVPIDEAHPCETSNNYGYTKLVVEDMARSTTQADPDWSVVLLRYFNPVGAHESGMIGENPNGIPNNLMPFISQVAVGKRKELSVFGGDYETHDGTGIRDYIHVMDLVAGHVAAIDLLNEPGCRALNLGTGQGYSVLEVIAAFERACGRAIPYRIVPRRPGDVAVSFADPARAQELMSWKATRDLDAMCSDAWAWQSGNPNGYG